MFYKRIKKTAIMHFDTLLPLCLTLEFAVKLYPPTPKKYRLLSSIGLAQIWPESHLGRRDLCLSKMEDNINKETCSFRQF